MPFDYHRPATLEEAWRLAAADPEARFVAGGTDVMVRIREGKIAPRALISLSRISDLARIAIGPTVVIGAGVRVAELERNASIRHALPVLSQAAALLGSTQIRNVATLGGNLCNASPCADLAPPLLVHDARARIATASGAREIPLATFFVGPRASVLAPGEVLSAVVVDPPAPTARAVFLKQGRVRMDIALASIAVLLDTDGRRCTQARVAAGSLGPCPMRLTETEAVLTSGTLDDATLARARAAAESEVRPITDVRAGADYRRHLAGALVERAVRSLMNGAER
ncbi:MAG: xanthine dehydrogenase family protein subunit M [Polyangiaceae bacterium]|nr:xanthine dehydrogenase family protein subunit M [Polyangiaceae bacterium]